MAKKKVKCLVPNCERDAAVRGVCRRCHDAARFMVKSGKITEAELIERGLILPARRSPMRAAIEGKV